MYQYVVTHEQHTTAAHTESVSRASGAPDETKLHDVGAFVVNRNLQGCREALGSVTPDDVYFGRKEAILGARRKLKVEPRIGS